MTDLKTWHLHKNGLLMDPRDMALINTKEGVEGLVALAKEKAMAGNPFVPIALAPMEIDTTTIEKRLATKEVQSPTADAATDVILLNVRKIKERKIVIE